MRRYLTSFYLVISFVFIATSQGLATDIASLPALPKDQQPTTDWLIDDSPYKAQVYRDGSGQIVLSNGLIARTFKLSPNCTTVGFDNLVTGQAIIRGVKPEAVVEINGVRYDVGGLKGQPNYAYLMPQWIDQLKADPAAFQFTGFTVAKPKPRMNWKRNRHHAPDANWPPKGVYLRMDYTMPKPTAEQLAGGPKPSDSGRKQLATDDFKKLANDWIVHLSKAHARSSFDNEGKVGEIYTPANTAVYVERKLPEGTQLVETTIDVGTDRSATWGPGLALVFKDRVIKFHIRPGGDNNNEAPLFGAFDGRSELSHIGKSRKLDISKPWSLRLRLDENRIYFEAKPTAGSWKIYHTLKTNKNLGQPLAVRIGKLDKTGGGNDFGGEKGDLVRLHVLQFSAYGSLSKQASDKRTQKVESLKQVRVSVHYELYDGIGVLSKWITVHNPSPQAIRLNRFTSEVLAAVEYSSHVEYRGVPFPTPNIHVETDYAFGGMTFHNASKHSVHWVPDPDYRTQANYLRCLPCLLEVRPELGPDMMIQPGKSFESFRAFVLPYDSTDRERKSLSVRKMYRTVAPWVTENPLMMHVRYADWNAVKKAIDQCEATGFEMVILTFGSGFNIENNSAEYIAKMKKYADYARSKGIEIGGYSLLASRRVGGGHDVVMPKGKRPTFGNSPCIGSKWGQEYFSKLYNFYDKTGFLLLEHDGSYPGDECLSTKHPGHRGHGDSRWTQWRTITDFYKYCRANGIYLNIPDFYYLSGSNKCGMGYREGNWSLPRAQQVIHTRQNIYDGTWIKTPSMGWMFVPLTQYHGGGAAATIEPLDKHLDHYRNMIRSNLAMGVQACYRGPRLYDTDRTMKMVKKEVDWFKKYRNILESDVIHGRRADGADIDWMLHVNPKLNHKGMLVVFNPLKKSVTKNIRVNLYYTGLTTTAKVRQEEGKAKVYQLDRQYNITLPVTVGAESMTWFVIE